LNSSLNNYLMLLMPLILRFSLYKKIIYIVRVVPGWTNSKLLRSRTDPHSAGPGISGPRTDPISLAIKPGPTRLGQSKVGPGLTLYQCSPLAICLIPFFWELNGFSMDGHVFCGFNDGLYHVTKIT